jgi:hypothetical protein
MPAAPDYRLVVRVHPQFVHAIGTGENVPENARRFLREAYEACVANGLDRLLLEMAFSGASLPAGSIFSIVSERSGDGTKLGRIAYVDRFATRDPEKTRFAETVAVNRMVNVRLFADVAGAERWLAEL